jgi:hypothetical protein
VSTTAREKPERYVFGVGGTLAAVLYAIIAILIFQVMQIGLPRAFKHVHR